MSVTDSRKLLHPATRQRLREMAAEAPPLTEQQRADLARLLRRPQPVLRRTA